MAKVILTKAFLGEIEKNCKNISKSKICDFIIKYMLGLNNNDMPFDTVKSSFNFLISADQIRSKLNNEQLNFINSFMLCINDDEESKRIRQGIMGIFWSLGIENFYHRIEETRVFPNAIIQFLRYFGENLPIDSFKNMKIADNTTDIKKLIPDDVIRVKENKKTKSQERNDTREFFRKSFNETYGDNKNITNKSERARIYIDKIKNNHYFEVDEKTIKRWIRQEEENIENINLE